MLRTISILTALALLAGFAPAQLSGSYTVDNTMATGGLNYNTLQEAANDLATFGISGPVTVQVVDTGINHTGFSIINPITGSSSVNTVTFLAVGSPVISGAASGYVQGIKLGGTSTASIGPSDIILDGLEVTGAPSGAGIIVAGCTNVVVRNCLVHTCGGGIVLVTGTGNTVEDCEVHSVGNTTGTPGNASYAGGIAVYYTGSGHVVQRNQVHDCTGNGIFLGSSGSTTAPSNVTIVNNFVWNCPGLGSYPGGIAIRRSGGSVISYNSIWMPAGTAFGGIHQMAGGANPQPAEISNNIVKHDGTGACFRFESTTVVVATVFDHNLYDPGASAGVGAVGATLVTPLAAWQANAAPSLAGFEVNSLEGSAGFVSPTDLHILAGSLAFNSGSAVAGILDDIDGDPRPLGGTPDIGADEAPAVGLFAGFSATPVSGSAPLLVNFSDNSFSSAGPVTSWAWDFENDGTDDAFVQNPSHTYTCPGSYSVKLTVNDGVNPTSTLVLTGYINVGNQVFSISTSGGGVGDLTINPVPTSCGPAMGAGFGWTLVSFATAGPVGGGPLFGLTPDAITFQFLFIPWTPGDILSFAVAPPLYPDGGQVNFPAGFFSALTGASMDAMMAFLTPGQSLLYVSEVSRVTF